MARPGSKMKAGYLPIEEHHYPALLSLVAPVTPSHRLLDSFAGEGTFLTVCSRWRKPNPTTEESNHDHFPH
jgi:hypothetical protein